MCNNKGVQSAIKHTEYGVPQGSVLEPLLFIIYSNDLPHSLKHCETILFADDTTVYFTHTNMQTLYRSVNSDLSTLDDWFRANQLSVNPTKTKYILFTKRSNLTDECSLFINDERLEKVKSTKFLGLHIAECFSWENHIGYCKSKIASGIYAINTSKHILSERNLKTFILFSRACTSSKHNPKSKPPLGYFWIYFPSPFILKIDNYITVKLTKIRTYWCPTCYCPFHG